MARSPAPAIVAPLGPVVTERLELRRFEAADLDGLAAVFARSGGVGVPLRPRVHSRGDGGLPGRPDRGVGRVRVRVLDPRGSDRRRSRSATSGSRCPCSCRRSFRRSRSGGDSIPTTGVGASPPRAPERRCERASRRSVCPRSAPCPESTNPPSSGSANGSACRFGGPCSVAPTDRRGFGQRARLYVMTAAEWVGQTAASG